jgi:hypothetical protein
VDEADKTSSTPKLVEVVIDVRTPQSVSLSGRVMRWAGDFFVGVAADVASAVAGAADWLRQHRKPVLNEVTPVAKGMWPPDGKPPDGMSNNAALQKLGDKLQELGINASITSQLRAIGRRK